MADDSNSDDAEPDEDERVEPDVPSEPQAPTESGKVLTPEELDITSNEYVQELDEDGRYVVSPGGGAPNVSRSGSDDDASDPADRIGSAGQSPGGPGAPDPDGTPVSPEVARTRLARELARTNARYGIDVVARVDGQTVRHRTVSNDVVGTFENFVQWYARQITDDTPVDQVVRILLEESSFRAGSDPNLAELLDVHDLDRHDSIADLVEAIRAESDREP